MFSGKDAANPAYPTQWALNPVAYQNVDTSQVDWAALAQQWIAMKEAAAIVGAPQASSKVEAEEGEAPMEVENPDANSESSVPPGAEWNAATNSWGAPAWNQWGWGWSGPGSVDSKIPTDPSMALIDGYPITDGPSMPGYTTGPIAPTFQHGYWTAPQAEGSENRDNGNRNNDNRRSKSRNRDTKPNRPRPPRDKIPMMPPVIEPLVMPPAMITPTIDAAKRRQLPAWIREGLEKMEREKQKAIEREQEKKALEEAEKEKKRLEEEELARLKAEASGVPMMPAKSKFDSDSEGEQESTKEDRVTHGSLKEELTEPQIREEPEDKPPVRSREEIMQEVMLAVRRSLTEILLEVTDHEIQLVSQEELARFNFHQASHLNAMKASKSKALSAITSGLGLGAYESSSDDSDVEESPNDLSDHQLMEVIRRKRAEFERTAREIEAEVRRAEMEQLAPPPAAATPERALPAHTVLTAQHTNDRNSSTPPPLVDSETPEKKPERHPSKEKIKNNHKSTERADGARRENNEDKRDSKKTSRYERTPSPPNTPDRIIKDTSNVSSSDSEEDSVSSSSDKSSSGSDAKAKEDRPKKRKRKTSSSSSTPKKSKNKKQAKEKVHKYDEKNSYSKSKRHDVSDYGKTEKSKSRRKDDYGYDKRKSSRSRDCDRSRDKYREASEDDRPKKRSRRSRSVSYGSRSGRRRTRDRSDDRYHRRDRRSYGRESSKRDRSHDRRDYDRNDKYARVRDERRRSRSNSRSRHRR